MDSNITTTIKRENLRGFIWINYTVHQNFTGIFTEIVARSPYQFDKVAYLQHTFSDKV
jgi:hypothetical protein